MIRWAELTFDVQMAHRSEEEVDVLSPRVDDDVVNVALFDLAQNVTVGGARALPDVDLHVTRRWRPHQILQP